jgi:hypothetical protein
LQHSRERDSAGWTGAAELDRITFVSIDKRGFHHVPAITCPGFSPRCCAGHCRPAPVWLVDRRDDPETGEQRDPVMRGGSWRSGAYHCTSIAHDPSVPTMKADNIGFRVACRVEKAK